MSPSLPFRQTGGQILDRDGDVLVTVAFDMWRTSSTSSSGGQIDLWSGVCEAEAEAPLVGKANRFFLANGVKYRVEDAIFHDLLGYVELTLRDPRAQG